MADKPLSEAWAELRLGDERFNADLRRLQTRLATIAKQIEQSAKIDIAASIDTVRTRQQIEAEIRKLRATGGIVVPIQVDTKAAASEIAGLVSTVEQGDLTIDVDADTGQAQLEVANAFRAMSAYERITFQLEARNDKIEEARQSVERLAILLSSLDSTAVEIDADLRDAGVRAELGRISALVAEVSAQPANIDIDVDSAGALGQLAAIQVAVEELDGREIDLNIDASSYAAQLAALRGVDEAARDTVDAKKGGIGRLVTALGFLGVGGVVGIGALGAGITAFGVKASADLQGTIKSFENLLGSAEAADELFKELQAFAIPSPFDTQVLATTTKSLLAIGVTAEEVVPVVKDLGAIVALLGGGSNEAFSRLTLALGQIRSATKPLTQDLRQITSAIPGFNTEMQLAQGVAEKFGISVAAAQDKIKDGSISGEEAFGIILERMQTFPGVAGSIEAAAGTLQGKLSAFADTAKQTLVTNFGAVTTLVQDSLDPLQVAVENSLKKIAPAIAGGLEELIPDIPALVESLGTGLAPAFEGIIAGLSGALRGLTPIIEQVLPLIGEIGPIVGDILADLGPVAADVGEDLGGILVPALQLLADVLDIMPTGVLSTLLTGFIAFKAVSGVQRVFQGISTSLLELGTRPGQIDAVTTAAGRLSSVMSKIGPAVVGLFAGMGLASDDATTKITSGLTAVATVGLGFASGGAVGGALATGAVLIGGIVGKFQEGKRKAQEMKEEVKRLAAVIAEAFPDNANVTLPDVTGLAEVRAEISRLLEEKGIKDDLLDLGIGLTTVTDKLGLQREEFEKWAISLFLADEDLAEHEKAVIRDAKSVEDAARQYSFFTQGAGTDMGKTLVDLDTTWETLNGSVEKHNEDIAFAQLGMYDATAAADLFEQRLQAAAGGLAAVATNLRDIPPGASEAASAFEGRLADSMETPYLGALEAANLFEERVAGLPAAQERAAAAAEALKAEFVIQFGEAEAAVQGVHDALSTLLGLLDTDIAKQNFANDLEEFLGGMTEIVNQDIIDQGSQLADDISAQKGRIAELNADLAVAQTEADLQAESYRKQIASARAAGAFETADQFESELAHVYDGLQPARLKLQEEYDKLRALTGDFDALDLTPVELIEVVRTQAAESGLSLADFLRLGTSDEAIAAFQEQIAPLFRGALSILQTTLEDEGPDAAVDLAQTYQDQLLAAFTPTLGEEAAQDLIDRYFPDDEWEAAGRIAGIEAREAAVAELLAGDGLGLSVGLAPDIAGFVEQIEDLEIDGKPVALTLEADTISFLAQLDALTPEVATFLEIPPEEIEDMLEGIEGVAPEVLANLGIDIDAWQAYIDENDGEVAATIPTTLDVDEDDFNAFLAGFNPEVRASMTADTSAIDDALADIETRTYTVNLHPDINNENFDTFLRNPGIGVAQFQRFGGVNETDRTPQIAFSPRMIVFGEQPTRSGEAFIPKEGGERSERILRYVAENWFGSRVVPMEKGSESTSFVRGPIYAGDQPAVDAELRDTLQELLKEIRGMRGRGRVTQRDYDGAVIVERIEKLMVGASEPARRAANGFIRELRQEALGI